MNNKKTDITVLIATCNYLNSLKICLTSLERQTYTNFEVIICDDGSEPDVGEWLKTYIPEAPFPLRHMWQEGRGFRKCRLLNQAMQEACGDYFVFIDSDCIQAKDFLEQHWKHREKGRYLGGRRVMIARKAAETVSSEMVNKGTFDHLSFWLLSRTILGQIKYLEDALPILHHLRPVHPFNLLWCNFSIHKEDILAVNGFDEEYESRGGWVGVEDIAARLELSGRRMKSVRYLARQYHLGHEIREAKSVSEFLFQSKLKKTISPSAAKQISSSLIRHQQSKESSINMPSQNRRKKVILLRNQASYNPGIYFAKGLMDLGVELIDIPIDINQPQPRREFAKADLLLVIDSYKPVEFPGIENFPGPKGFYSIDSCHKLAIHKAYVEKYNFDCIWVAQKHVVDEFGEKGIWLPLAADEGTHIFRPEMMAGDSLWQQLKYHNHYDVTMCGASYPHRRRCETLFKQARLSTNFHYGAKYSQQATREMARSTIGFNVAAGFTGEKGLDINMRVFETMANGQSMLLTNTYDNLGYEELFEEGKHYIGFRNEQEAVEKAIHFSHNPEAAHKIARNGQSLILAKHTYRHRCQTILSALDL